MTAPTFYVWPLLSAFDAETIGSKVTDPERFMGALGDAVASFDFNAETNEHVTTTGQGLVPLPGGLPYVSAGVGPKSVDPAHYVLREWRGDVKAFLRREYAAPVESLAAVVYTTAAYLADPDIKPEDARALTASGATHCIVAVLANAGPKPPAYSPGRLVQNLAGGNRSALVWTADEIREHAKAAAAYANEWDVVAD